MPMLLTQEDMQQMFDYNPENGILRWRNPRWRHSRANRVKPGDIAGYWVGGTRGRLVVELDGKSQALASVIWLWMTDYWPMPPNEIVDHINRNPRDNRWDNLKLSSILYNSWNRSKNSNNSTGYMGVSWNARDHCFESYIGVNYKRIYLGRFASAEDAYKAYQEAVIKYRGEESVE